MKQVITLVLALGTLMACEKDPVKDLVYISLKSVHHTTGEIIPDVNFTISENDWNTYNTIDETTDTNGLYIGTIEQNTSSIYMTTNSPNYVVAKPTVDVVVGEHNQVNLELIAKATFQINFNCSGGYIQNVSRSLLVPIPVDSYLSNNNEGKTRVYTNPYCGGTYIHDVYAGDWIITYEKRPNTSSSWVTYSDTVNVLPGEAFTYQINY